MSEENTDKINFDDILSQDAEAIEAFLKNFYSKSVPPPQQPTKEDLSFWRIAGLQSSMFSLAAFGGIILSAIRTGGIFYIIELALVEKFNLGVIGTILAFISMIAALGAFELFVLAFGIDRGMKSERLTVSGWGVGIALVTIVCASIFSSFSIVNLSDSLSEGFDIIMSLVSGFASAAVVYYSSENLGFVVNSVSRVRNEKLSAHASAFKNWRQNGVSQYLDSIYNIRHKRSSKVYSKPVQNEQVLNKGVQSGSNKNNVEQENEQEIQEPFKRRSKVELAYAFIEKQYKLGKIILSSRDVVAGIKRTGESVSAGTAFTAISQFIVNNSESLILDGAISQEDVERAICTFEKLERAKNKVPNNNSEDFVS